ncbi:MAG TPA: hypothetical protein VMV56_00095 [Williamwhitmania sp.]|nr:hypothetical protein [Williamwhitmania sp.]
MIAKIKQYWKLKRLGYVNDQLGIAHRFRQEGNSWNNHLAKSKQAILAFVAKGEYKSIAILGSGWLLDVPLDELVAQNKKVILVDILHPKQVLHQWKDNPLVQFVEADLTAGAVNIFNNVVSRKISKEEAIFLLGNLHPENLLLATDAVISVNLLSQLAQIPVERLKDKGVISDHFATTTSRILQQQHLMWLSNHDCLLISDIEEELFDEDEKLCGTNPLVEIDKKKWQQIDRWKWRFDTRKTYRQDFKTRLNVGVFEKVK